MATMIVDSKCMECGQTVVPGEHSGHSGHFTGAWYCHDCGVLCDGADDTVTLDEYQAREMFRDSLDELYGDASIAGINYSTSYALEACDPIAFQQMFVEYVYALAEMGTLVEGYTA